MSDKLGSTPPPHLPASHAQGAGPQTTAAQASGQAARLDPRLAAKSKMAAATSVEVDASISLDAASAQLSALRNQANAAAASGDLSTLQQLAVHAVALGVAAGQNAENLANAIAAKAAAGGGVATAKASAESGAENAGDLTALGLKPEDIARLFTQPDDAANSKPQPSAADSSMASGLHQLAALNARASAVITDARHLLASMNATIGAVPLAGTEESRPVEPGSSLDQGVTLNGLSQLLDQAESALTAKVFAVAQQVAGTPAPGGDAAPEAKSAALDVKT